MKEFTKFKDNVIDVHNALQKANDMIATYCRYEKKFVQIENKFMPAEHGVYVNLTFKKSDLCKPFTKLIDYIYEDYTNCSGCDTEESHDTVKVVYFKSYYN